MLCEIRQNHAITLCVLGLKCLSPRNVIILVYDLFKFCEYVEYIFAFCLRSQKSYNYEPLFGLSLLSDYSTNMEN